MNKLLALSFCAGLMIPAISNASMSVMENSKGEVIGVDPWSYLDETNMWTTTRSSYPVGGYVHGQYKMKYTVDTADWQGEDFNKSSDTLTLGQAVLRFDEFPNWYLAFSHGRKTNYRDSFNDHSYDSQYNWTEVFVGREFFMKNLRLGGDLSLGSNSFDNVWTGKGKIFADYRLTDKFSVFAYAYKQINLRRNDNNTHDLQMEYTAFEPGIQYIINNDTGVFFRHYFEYGNADREIYTDAIDRAWLAYGGIWHNFGKLSTTLSGGYGHYRLYEGRADVDREIFKDQWTRYAKITANYPITNRFTLSGEITGNYVTHKGTWLHNGESLDMEYKVMLDFNF